MRLRWLWLRAALVAVCAVYLIGYIVLDATSEEPWLDAGLALGFALASAFIALLALLSARNAVEARDDLGQWDVILNVPSKERPTFRQRLLADGGVAAFWCGVGVIFGGMVSYLVAQLPGL